MDPTRFQETFGASLDSAQSLLEAKTLTLPKLLPLLDASTMDPSPLLYHDTLYAMAGLAMAAAAMHFAVRPVHERHFEKEEDKEDEKKVPK